MMLIGVLLLAALFSGDVAADPDLNIESENLTETNQDLEKRYFSWRGLCHDGVYYFGHCYKFVHSRKTWIDAELYCRTLRPGSHLASIHWANQNVFIWKVITEAKGIPVYTWIGLSDSYKERTFLWTDGSPTDFTKWNKHQPDDQRSNEDCVHLGHDGDKLWNDMRCNKKLPFICSYKLPGY